MMLRYAVFAALAAGAALAQPQLAIVKPLLNQIEDGSGIPAGYRFVPGETIFFRCMVSGYKASEDKKVDVAARVEFVDPKGAPLAPAFDKEVKAELADEDKNWMPKISTSVQVPVLINPGTYRFVVTAEDKVGGGKAKLEVPFQVGGRPVDPSDSLIVRDFRFLKSENDTIPVADGIYHPGEELWAKFEITGFKYGPNNHVKLGYGIKVVNAAGREIYNQPNAATEDSESFYPKQYLPGVMSLNLDKDVEKTGYTILIEIHDDIGNQTYVEKRPFKVE